MTFRSPLSILALLIALTCPWPAEAAELRGTVTSVTANGQVRIDLPAGAAAKTGDEVRIETVVPGVGPVMIKTRWRVTQTGEGFVLAEPQGTASGAPQAGYAAIVISRAPAASAPGAVPLSVPPLKLTGDELAALLKRAEGGDVQAMNRLGTYHTGSADPSDSVTRSLDEAVRWHTKAATAGDTAAMTFLGFLYRTRRNDDTKAAEWFRKAADKGDAAARSMLSGLYAEGRGVTKDAVKSFEWEKKAAQKGDELVAYNLAEMYFRGLGTRQDFVEAAHWYRKAADKEYVPAMTQLGRIYASGLGVARDSFRGFGWSHKAAEKGSAIAMYHTGTFYLYGVGVAKDTAEALRWYEKSANAGEAEGMFGLGYLYDKSIGATANPGLAADWMILAIRAHSFQAAQSVMQTPHKWSAAFRRELQKRLRETGVYDGPIDGDIGSGSRQAIATLTRSTMAQ